MRDSERNNQDLGGENRGAEPPKKKKPSFEEETIPLEPASAFDFKIYNYAIIVLLIYTMYNYFGVIYKIADQAVGGNWRSIPPLSMINHPHPDFHLSFEELVKQEEGLNFERHSVITEDGYINTAFRVLKEGEFPGQRPVVVLLHGIIDSGDTYFLNGRNKSVGFILADEGYDVWAYNTRGSKHSEAHKTLDPKTDIEYWHNGGMHDIALRDLPALFKYVKKVTGTPNFTVIGHSQGTQQVFYNLEKQKGEEFSKYINLFVALGPVASVTDIESPANRLMSKIFYYSEWGMSWHGFKRAFPSDSFIGFGFKWVCGYAPFVCNFGMSLIAETTNEFNDPERSRVFLAHYPAGASYKNFGQIWENYQVKGFIDEDKGSKEANMKEYGQESPPVLDLMKVNLPEDFKMVVIVAKHDYILTMKDQRTIRDSYKKNIVAYKEIDGGHIIFMVAKDIGYLWSDVVPNIKKYNPLPWE